MSYWKIAAAQYEPPHTTLAGHVARHLQFIEAAARQHCELLVFPSLSLTGCSDKNRPLPAPPDEALMRPLVHAASTHRMTIIAGLPVEHHCKFVEGVAVFAPWKATPLLFAQGHNTCVSRQQQMISVLSQSVEGMDIDPAFSLFTTSQSINDNELFTSTCQWQRFSHRFAISVLMANARRDSALWDEAGQLIVRAGSGSLLLTGQRTAQGWQGDIIPLREAFLTRKNICCEL
ncbi:TPA: carbon-nitrogen hydrolase family protein [Citrobacter freundii]